MKNFLRSILRELDIKDHRQNFQPEWYSVLYKPLFITRYSVFQNIKNFAKNVHGKKILDVGCGEAPYRSLFTNCEYIGIDIEGGGHDDTLKNVNKFYDGMHIPYGDNEFDIVLFTGVLEHAEEPEIILAEINRVLKQTGTLYLMAPFASDEHAIPYDFIRLTTFGLQKLLKRHNLVPKSIEKTTGIFGTIGQLTSSFLFEEFFGTVRLRGYRKRFLLQKIFAIFICFPIQAVSLSFDTIFRKRGITLCYIAIASKPV